MYRILMEYKNKTDEQKRELTVSVINSVKIYGCEALAEYLVKVYQHAIEEKKTKRSIA